MTSVQPGRRLIGALPIALLAFALLLPALFNRFPLIFPDSGTYLSIGFGREYAIDRSSVYGFFLKPFVSGVPSLTGLWLAIGAQCLLLAALLWPVALIAARDARRAAVVLALIAVLTSVGWHAGQIMPDAFTGATVLLGWLCARRDPGDSGSPALWLAAIAAASMHYTHVVLLAVAIGVTLMAEGALGLGWRRLARRAAAAVAALALVVLGQVWLNATILQRPAMAPLGPLFLFARLNEDGLIEPWLKRNCGPGGPVELCALAPRLPRDSQALLWGGSDTPISDLVWHADPPESRWPLIDQMDAANRGAVLDRPGAFLANSLDGAARQFVHFAPLDDECPVGCHDRSGGIGFTLDRFQPASLGALDASRQVTDENPKTLLRAVMIPVAALGLLMLPLLGWLAWRRRDRDALALVATVGAALIVNGALAGALSDVHDRYQSRLVWLAPLAALLLTARWMRVKKGVVEPWGIGNITAVVRSRSHSPL